MSREAVPPPDFPKLTRRRRCTRSTKYIIAGALQVDVFGEMSWLLLRLGYVVHAGVTPWNAQGSGSGELRRQSAPSADAAAPP